MKFKQSEFLPLLVAVCEVARAVVLLSSPSSSLFDLGSGSWPLWVFKTL